MPNSCILLNTNEWLTSVLDKHTLGGLRRVWRPRWPACAPAAGVWGGRLSAAEGRTRGRTGTPAAPHWNHADWEYWHHQLAAPESTVAPVCCPDLRRTHMLVNFLCVINPILILSSGKHGYFKMFILSWWF